MYWINVNEKYLDYLREVDARIPFTDYGSDKHKPFFGVLFKTDELCYVTQISHPQPQHKKLKQTKDFYKIYDTERDATRLIGVVHLNYMFPMPRSEFEVFQMSKIREYRTFNSETEKSKYIDLLRREIREINKLPLAKNAKLIYENKYRYPDDYNGGEAGGGSGGTSDIKGGASAAKTALGFYVVDKETGEPTTDAIIICKDNLPSKAEKATKTKLSYKLDFDTVFFNTYITMSAMPYPVRWNGSQWLSVLLHFMTQSLCIIAVGLDM